jgi:hypothetical protein
MNEEKIGLGQRRKEWRDHNGPQLVFHFTDWGLNPVQ